MHAISVKRQRKLKMKKHKYKKLMKRTRNLRRRLDRN
ncbi:MAG: AURKAIP1/COX24 domain-containing protein [Proteobacteria bacterium]|nr:MAG: AURKAIP1/COX24 domain-containing protein [Pseudomonadota bacterium]